MRRACWLAPLAVLLWRLAPLAAAAAPAYTDPDGWGRAEECVNWSEDDGTVGGMQPVDALEEIFPELLYPAILDNLNISAWKKCCAPTFNLLSACYQALFPAANVHVVVRLRCQMTCVLSGRLRNLQLPPVTVDAQASVPFDASFGAVQFTQFKIKTTSVPIRTRFQ